MLSFLALAPLLAPTVQQLAPTGLAQATPARRPTDPSSRVLWRHRLDGPYARHRPAIGPDGTVYVDDVAGTLHAISPGGVERWNYTTFGAGAQGPVAVGHDGTVYVAHDPLGPTVELHALAPDGTPLWIHVDAASQGVIAGPAVGPDGNVYAATDVGGAGLLSLTPAGSMRWSNPGSPTLAEHGQVGAELVFGASSPGATPDRVFLAFDLPLEQQGRLFAFDLDGAQVFSVPTGGQTDVFLQFQAQPAVGPDGRVRLTSLRTTTGWVLETFDPTSGAVLQQVAPFPANGMSPPWIAPDGTTYLVRSLGRLSAYDPSGTELWQAFDGSIQYGPVASPDGTRVVVGGLPNFGQPGFVRCYADDGSLLWQEDLGSAHGGAVVPDSRATWSADGRTVYLSVQNPAAGTAGDLLALDARP